ncbi:hypothetical protein J2T55_002429 [Methylohalomonas lacus]|uniref:ATP-grasp domain-containing protein n=1 Tax=Methylohalomonas lacus TaxID=398773 RepID=A0AAE3HPE1_9GAMM|nr:hypothetical protein [Methylohalomonas lacus]MCS3904393.1 hypothetical protein [Methylohalomonas lacus]
MSIWSYDRLLRQRRLPPATWIFTDLDRLDFWELELASRIYNKLKENGQTVYNNPARIGDRYLLLRQLHKAGFNRFNAWHAGDSEQPDRYPVFLRTNRAHRGILTGELINNKQELEQAIESAVADGYPLRELIIVEYCAEPDIRGLYYKFAAFRCGDRIMETAGVLEDKWSAKYGTVGLANDNTIKAEYDRIQTTPNAEELMQAFSFSNIEYGRADYTIIDGKVQIYEINTNPHIGIISSPRYKSRLQSDKLFYNKLLAALKDMNSNKGSVAKLDDWVFRKQRRKDWFFRRSGWVP